MKIYKIEPYYELEIDDQGVRIRSYSEWAKGREMKQSDDGKGYLRVKMNRKTVYVHVLVALYTIGPRPEGMTVNHKDGKKQNNQPDNLEYISQPKQIEHAIALGLHTSCDPKRHGMYIDGRATGGNKAEYSRERKRKLRKANPEMVREQERKRYWDNPEKYRERVRESYRRKKELLCLN